MMTDTEQTTIASKSQVRLGFFELLFGNDEGYICLACSDPRVPKASFEQQFFAWPKEAIKAEQWILKVERSYNVYFCVNLLEKRERRKKWCLPTNLLWADLDEVNPQSIDDTRIPPPIVIRSSVGRWQAIWRMTTKIDPYQAEDYSRRIAYMLGADVTGWDLTQMLRVPFTSNFKYDVPQPVELERCLEIEAKPLLFEAIPAQVDRDKPLVVLDTPLPDDNLATGTTADAVIYKYGPHLQRTPFFSLFSQEPEDDWSGIFWAMLNTCYKVGMSQEEVFAVAREAACNKYARDGRPIEHVWRDVLKCGQTYKLVSLPTDLIQMPKLVEGESTHTFIDTYREWAIEATDAVPDFHDLSIFIVLSAIISNSVRLETSAGMMTPNLWGLILGDSTLTRKTTAMRLATDHLMTMDPELVLATDGTAEGILSGLATRPNRSSIFLKDEISGLFESMSRKDYMAGLQETFTALYDVPPVYTRRLRKETIVIEAPSFVFLGGGVTERVYSAVNDSFVLSGFLPRFLVVYGEAEVEDRRPLGPPTESGLTKKPVVFNMLADLYETYAGEIEQHIGGQKVRMPAKFTARMTAEAWSTNAGFEAKLLNAGKNSLLRDLALPTFDRMSRSLLKMAVILAAVRQKPSQDGSILVEADDLTNAATYVQRWGQNSINLIVNAGKGSHEKVLDRIFEYVCENPGINKSDIFRRYHLGSRDGNIVMDTMEERAMVRKERRGPGFAYWPIIG